MQKKTRKKEKTWKAASVCARVRVCVCDTLGSICRFEVGSPGAHSDNCASILFHFSLFSPIRNICLIAARIFVFFLAIAELLREQTKKYGQVSGSGRSPWAMATMWIYSGLLGNTPIQLPYVLYLYMRMEIYIFI